MNVPKVSWKISKPKKVKAARTGGHYRGTGSSKYWYSDAESFICTYCDFGYHTAKERARHHQIHEEPYKCPDCDYTNVRQDSLSNHMLTKHSQIVELVREERKKKRENVPLPSVSKAISIANSEPDKGASSTLYVILPQQNTISVQTGP